MSESSALDRVKPYAKTVVGFITPGVVALVAAVQDASPGGAAVTGPEWVAIGAACILTGAAVFTVPNAEAVAPAARGGNSFRKVKP